MRSRSVIRALNARSIGRYEILLVSGEVVPVRVPGEAVAALGALPVALHQASARVEQPPAQQHRLAEQVAAIALAFGRRDGSEIDGPAHRVGGDHVECLAPDCRESTWVIASCCSVLRLALELIGQAEPAPQDGRLFVGSERQMIEAEVVVVRDCRRSAADRSGRRASRRTVRRGGRPPRPCGAARWRMGTSAHCPGRAWRRIDPMCGMSARLIEFTSRHRAGIGIAREHPVRAAAMIVVRVSHRADEADLVHPAGGVRHQLGKAHAGDARSAIVRELAANVVRSVRLGVERVELGRPAGEIKDDAILRLAETPRRPSSLRRGRSALQESR